MREDPRRVNDPRLCKRVREDGSTGQTAHVFMKRSTKNQAEGRFHEAKGKVKETAGKLIDDPVIRQVC
jgi:hypothetical protein